MWVDNCCRSNSSIIDDPPTLISTNLIPSHSSLPSLQTSSPRHFIPTQSLVKVTLPYYPCLVVPPIHFRVLASWLHTSTMSGTTKSSLSASSSIHSLDEAEKGMYDATLEVPAPGFVYMSSQKNLLAGTASPVHQGITPCTSMPELSLSLPAGHTPTDAATLDTTVKKPTAPKPQKPKISRWILFDLWFNTYRKFFTFVVLLNLTGIILAATNHFRYAEDHLGALVLGNLLCAILMRNELWMRFLYLVAIYGLSVCAPPPQLSAITNTSPKWAPVCVKLAATSVLQHVGGIHSGCALSGAAWLVYKIVDIIKYRAVQHPAVIASGIITNVFIIISIVSAFPWVRNTYHNVFERHHRFVGWLGLAMTWVFVILGNSYDIKKGEWRSDTNSLLSAQELWFAVCMTIFILIPWVTLREVPVEVEIPSPKVAVLKFERGMQQGLLGRISRTSIMEYHAFGIISEGRHATHHYMVCGVQGDFTKGLVSNPPKTVWTRQLKFAGVGHVSAMFKRGIRICTGTGIGAALSTCIQSPNWFLIWIGSDQESTFGPTITGLIHKHIEPERMILWDSKKRGGRPDTMELLRDTWTRFGAEVIFITSNSQGNDEMMRGCKKEGMHAFGTLWEF
ncbi:non-ribosomal peptide synthetase [Pyrenophora seminiperda CCB06]|uniref:Non-ribosomal peptide synthetase n=1 Tax=Pyrenophora seminiperda CCB06 TaxID=1302712 RepID=A0A3M7MIQ6_9PLEO|nr:non-ribosomal peptide synthetase [Pyrenophora seminiperda CCB06]